MRANFFSAAGLDEPIVPHPHQPFWRHPTKDPSFSSCEPLENRKALLGFDRLIQLLFLRRRFYVLALNRTARYPADYAYRNTSSPLRRRAHRSR